MFEAHGRGFRAQYLVDRAHSVPLDNLVTGGAVGLTLWLAATGAALAVGARRLAAATGAERAMRTGALGAAIGALTEGLVGIATPVPLMLYWLAVGLLVSPPWGGDEQPTPLAGRARVALAAAVGLVALFVVTVSTRWMLASIAYAEGTRLGLAGRLADAAPRFDRARALMPWVALSGEARAYAEFRLALLEREPARQRAGLARAAQIAATTRAEAGAGAAGFALAGQIALAQARAGEPDRLDAGFAAFGAALAWRPTDSHLQAQWGWALLERGQIGEARHRARAALAVNPSEWLAFAVLAKAASLEGDHAAAQGLREQAERMVPPDARPIFQSLMR